MSGRDQRPLAAWQAELGRADECPYVGPRPQSEDRDGHRMLIGREADLRRMNKAVLHRSLVVVHGYSGVGKSSLLQNGLFSRLGDAGFSVLVSRRWDAAGVAVEKSEAQLEAYLASCIKMTHQDALAPVQVPDGVSLQDLERSEGLSKTCGEINENGRAVLVLDQFEELLRQDKNAAERVVKWVIDLGYRQDTHVLISLRTDSLHHLDPMLRGVKAFSMDRVSIGDLSDKEAIEEVIRTARIRPSQEQEGLEAGDPATSAGLTELISEPAVKALVKLWEDYTPSLLDLQATLYAIYFRSQVARGASQQDIWRIEEQDITALEEDAQSVGAGGLALNPFSFGLREAIRLKIEHAEAASQEAGLDQYLVSGTRQAVRRAAPLLSSGDFKVPIGEIELAQRVLGRELRVLERQLVDEGLISEGSLKAEAGTLVEELFTGLRESPDLLSLLPSDLSSHLELQSRSLESKSVPSAGAGPMMGASAADILLEELRRVAFAIEWLVATEIVRRDPAGTLLLVHDGSGGALRLWADRQADAPRQALCQLTAARGEHFVWREKIGGETSSVISNINWRDCRISADFSNVVFVNCDFTGSRFDGCGFEGVTFVNCLLDDANFENCVIRGRMDMDRIERRGVKGRARLAPSFTVEASQEAVRAFGPYPQPVAGDGGLSSAQFFSDTAGTPAVPGAVPDNHTGDVVAHLVTSGGSSSSPHEVRPATGGVIMVGGRVCFLTLYRCRYEAQGSFAFHLVSGDGLFVVEQDQGRIEIHDGAIRGISISRDREEESPSSGDKPASQPSIELEVNDSLVANLYFSNDLTGRATLRNCFVLMLMNASENSPEGFEVNVENCLYEVLVNTNAPDEDSIEISRSLPEGSRKLAPVPGYDSLFNTPDRAALARDLEAMDYRFKPEVWEQIQRRSMPARNSED